MVSTHLLPEISNYYIEKPVIIKAPQQESGEKLKMFFSIRLWIIYMYDWIIDFMCFVISEGQDSESMNSPTGQVINVINTKYICSPKYS